MGVAAAIIGGLGLSKFIFDTVSNSKKRANTNNAIREAEEKLAKEQREAEAEVKRQLDEERKLQDIKNKTLREEAYLNRKYDYDSDSSDSYVHTVNSNENVYIPTILGGGSNSSTSLNKKMTRRV